jgi:hypothetical protein
VALGRAVGALVRAASAKQLTIVVLVALGALLVLLDLATNDAPAEQHSRPESGGTQPVAEPPPDAAGAERVAAEPEHRGPLALIFSGAAAVRFFGFSALSLAVLGGVLVLFWRAARRSDP